MGGKKKGGRKPAAAKAAAAPKPPMKRAPANKQSANVVGQRLITQVLKPAEDARVSPDRKVRKMRASPFNKKSGAVLGKNTSGSSTSHESEEVSPPISSLGSLEEEVSEVIVAPKARPQRANRGKKTTYVISDSDTEEDDIVLSDDTDFDGDDFDGDDD